MISISEIQKIYKGQIDYLDIELIIAHSLKKTREFVLMHPEYLITSRQQSMINELIKRRVASEPIAYIVRHKEFYGLNFIVNKNTLIPRPETEQLVESAISEQRTINNKNTYIFDIGTGSGNIIISIAHELEKNIKYKIQKTKYYAIDISNKTLAVAKKNAKNHGLHKKIKFLCGKLLLPLKNLLFIDHCSLVIVANLPYLSKEIYVSAPVDVKRYEPKSALYSGNGGLAHYEKLLKQLQKISTSRKLKTVSCFLEISPEQKQSIAKLIKNIFPFAKITFLKDLGGKWRVCKINL